LRFGLLLVALGVAEAFYLPGVAPRAFKDGDNVNIKVQTLVSTETPLQFDYYQLPFCAPKKVQDLPENLGEALVGEKAHTSAFQAVTKKNEYCKTLCRKNYTPQQMEEFQDFAILDYRVNMRLDNLPVAEMNYIAFEDKPKDTIEIYNLGFPLGRKLEEEASKTDQYVLNNHLRFKILYHPVESDDGKETDGNYIVGFHVYPYSIKHTYRGKWNSTGGQYARLSTCKQPPMGQFNQHDPLIIDATEGQEVVWTYDIEWVRSNVKWASRWDVYLQMNEIQDDKIHWFSIINSLVIVVFLTGIVGIIMTRILRKDFARYNEVALSEEERAEMNREMREETGWKLVYADVFRPPPHAALLSVYAGSGMQLFVMSILTLTFAAFGFLSPANRGALLSSILFFYVLMGVPAGYTAARFCKLVKEPNHFKTTLLTSVIFPGVCFAMFFVINMVVWTRQSSTAVPFGTLIVLMILWFGISLPLVFFGAYLGFKREVIEVPCITNPIPRQIPPQPWYLSSICSFVVGGLLPFGVVFVEMLFILSSIWQHRFYYMFGFLFLVFAILVVTCAEIAVVLCYIHLCSEDYRWWWRSFVTSGSTAFYMYAYACYHFFSRAHPSATFDMTSTSVYFGYMFIICYAIFVLTGYIGFISCFMFTKAIYGSIKID